MNKEADSVEVALINKRLAELFNRASTLRISLAELAKTALDEGWTDEHHQSLREKPLNEMAAARTEIHKLTDRLTEIKNQGKNSQ